MKSSSAQAQIQFDREPDGKLSYGQEAAHSRRRIIHVADGTGAAISNGLVALLKNYPNIEVLSNATAVDLITYPHHCAIRWIITVRSNVMAHMCLIETGKQFIER